LKEHGFYIEKINEILKRHLTQKSYDLWIGIYENISNKCLNLPTSSTKKHHLKEDGRCPTVGEHTFEMLYITDKIIPMFEGMFNKNVIFLGIAMHDIYKYGLNINNIHTHGKHDQIIAETIKKNQKIFTQALSLDDTILLEEIVRFHMGRWSSNAPKNFNYSNYTPLVLFLSTLDMLSANNCLKILEGKK
jgi:hypothetical protein